MLTKKIPYLFPFIMIFVLSSLGFFDEPGIAFANDNPLVKKSVVFYDDFNSGTLSESLWEMTGCGDVKTALVDLFKPGVAANDDSRLRLLLDTIGTADDTVKYRGIRSRNRIHFNDHTVISFELDWNEQANGCYLSVAVYLCPTVTKATAGEERDWLKLEYVGVPPGKNVRFQVVRKTKGMPRFLYDEGWPHKQRFGRKIGKVQVELNIDLSSLQITENGTQLGSIENHGLNFDGGYLYLEMSSHSNYPARTIYFDNIVVTSSAEPRSSSKKPTEIVSKSPWREPGRRY